MGNSKGNNVYLHKAWLGGAGENTERSDCTDQTDHRKSGCLDGPEWSMQHRYTQYKTKLHKQVSVT